MGVSPAEVRDWAVSRGWREREVPTVHQDDPRRGIFLTLVDPKNPSRSYVRLHFMAKVVRLEAWNRMQGWDKTSHHPFDTMGWVRLHAAYYTKMKIVEGWLVGLGLSTNNLTKLMGDNLVLVTQRHLAQKELS